jgi:hypothetical protein
LTQWSGDFPLFGHADFLMGREAQGFHDAPITLARANFHGVINGSAVVAVRVLIA